MSVEGSWRTYWSWEFPPKKAKWLFSFFLSAECCWLFCCWLGMRPLAIVVWHPGELECLQTDGMLCSQDLCPQISFTSLPMAARRHHRTQPIRKMSTYSKALIPTHRNTVSLRLTLPFRLYSPHGTSTYSGPYSPSSSVHILKHNSRRTCILVCISDENCPDSTGK